LTQEPRLLLLDEPSSHLDLKYQIEIFSLLKELQQMLNLGYIRKRNDGILELTINKIAEIKEFVAIVKPFSLFKCRQLELLERIIDAKKKIENGDDFRALLKLVDAYRELNYSKKRLVHP